MPRYDEEAFMQLNRPRLWPLIILYFIGVGVITASIAYFDGGSSVVTLTLVGVGTVWNLFWIWGLSRRFSKQQAWDNARSSYDPSRWG